jgi:hypothetical protein
MHIQDKAASMDSSAPDQQQPEFFAHYLKNRQAPFGSGSEAPGAAIERSKALLGALDGMALVAALCPTLDGPDGERGRARGAETGYGATTCRPI